MTAWTTKTPDVKLVFLEIFEVCGNLIYCCCEEDLQKRHLFQQISRVNVFYVKHIACGVATVHADTFNKSKGIFCITCDVTPFEK